jgi:hypothetical protein
VLDTTGSFTVSAWVNPAVLAGWTTFVVQKAATTSGLFLEYDGGSHKWVFARAGSDTVNQWLTATPTYSTYAAREFLQWARQHHLTVDVTIPKKPHHHSLAPITEDDRWMQLRRCLHETALSTAVRAAGALVLLFGLPVSRITTLRHHDIHTDPDGNNWLQMTHHRLLLPAAVAALLRDQRDHGTGAAMLTRDEHRWLFPGGLPGRPARDGLYRARSARTCPSTSAEPAAPLSRHSPPISLPPSSHNCSTSTSTPPSHGPTTPNMTGAPTSPLAPGTIRHRPRLFF